MKGAIPADEPRLIRAAVIVRRGVDTRGQDIGALTKRGRIREP